MLLSTVSHKCSVCSVEWFSGGDAATMTTRLFYSSPLEESDLVWAKWGNKYELSCFKRSNEPKPKSRKKRFLFLLFLLVSPAASWQADLHTSCRGHDLQIGSAWFLSCLKSGVEFGNQPHLVLSVSVSDCLVCIFGMSVQDVPQSWIRVQLEVRLESRERQEQTDLTGQISSPSSFFFSLRLL